MRGNRDEKARLGGGLVCEDHSSAVHSGYGNRAITALTQLMETAMTLFVFTAAYQAVRQWLEQLTPVNITRARLQEWARHDRE